MLSRNVVLWHNVVVLQFLGDEREIKHKRESEKEKKHTQEKEVSLHSHAHIRTCMYVDGVGGRFG